METQKQSVELEARCWQFAKKFTLTYVQEIVKRGTELIVIVNALKKVLIMVRTRKVDLTDTAKEFTEIYIKPIAEKNSNVQGVENALVKVLLINSD